MSRLTEKEREGIVIEAMTWLNTPYHHQAGVKGAGVDCLMLLVEVYKALGLIPADVDPRPYVPDWHMHRSEELYLGGIENYAEQVDKPEKGDIAMFEFGRCISHAAIVLKWPIVIHAYAHDRQVVLSDVEKSVDLKKRLRFFYTLR